MPETKATIQHPTRGAFLFQHQQPSFSLAGGAKNTYGTGLFLLLNTGPAATVTSMTQKLSSLDPDLDG